MSKKKVRLALIGKGSWGQNYIRTISALRDCELPARFIKTHDYTKLLKEKFDGVIIATPPSTHFSIAKEFIKHGHNVLVEKPFTTSYKDAVKLAEIATRMGVIAMVGHLYCYHPAFLALKNLVGRIGKIGYIESIGVDWGPVRSDVSALWDWAPHDIYMCLAILKKEPVSISAWAIRALRPRTDLYDLVNMKLNFPKNVTALVTVGWLSPVKKRRFTVVGEKGSLLFDDLEKQKVTWIEGVGENRGVTYPTYAKALPLTHEVLAFIDCIKNKRKPKTDFAQGALTVKIIEAAEKSIRLDGKEVKM